MSVILSTGTSFRKLTLDCIAGSGHTRLYRGAIVAKSIGIIECAEGTLSTGRDYGFRV